MLISPKTAIENQWITHPRVTDFAQWDEAKYVSPNAIDFTVDHMFNIAFNNRFAISEDGKQMRGDTAFMPVQDRATGKDFWNLEANHAYDCVSDMFVNIPDGVVCLIIGRSTFTRNGLFLTSGLYDQGFRGSVGCVLHNPYGETAIAPGTRIGQIMFVESQSYGGMYKGGWNHEANEHWSAGANGNDSK